MNSLQMIMSNNNPQQVIMSILENQMSNTPIGQNLLSLAKSNNYNGIEQIARNMCASQGKDFDSEFNSFKKLLNIK